jgi:hypothetical protein
MIPFISRYKQSNSGIRLSAISCETAGYLSDIHRKNFGIPIMNKKWGGGLKDLGCSVKKRRSIERGASC